MAAATTLGIIGAATSAASAAGSFIQAGEQNKLERQASLDAAKAMAEAKRRLDINYADRLAIQKEPYELEKEALISAGAQSIQAGVESERGAAATAGRVALAQNEAQGGQRAAMSKDLATLEEKSADEASRLADVGVQLNLGEVEGAQQAAADAARARASAVSQGMAGIQSLGQQVIEMAPLYAKSASAKQFDKLETNYNAAAAKGGLDPKFLDAAGKALPFQQAVSKMGNTYGFDVAGVGAMQPSAFQDYMTQQKSSNLRGMRDYNFFAPQTQ